MSAAAVKRGCDVSVMKEESLAAYNNSRKITELFKYFISEASKGRISVNNAMDVKLADLVFPALDSDLAEIYIGVCFRDDTTNMFYSPTFVVRGEKKITAVDVYRNKYDYSQATKAAFLKNMGIDYKVFMCDNNGVRYDPIEPDYGKLNNVVEGNNIFSDTDQFLTEYNLK